MITYMCKYAPIEILEAFGTPVAIMEPDVANFTQADTLMHPNMCSYVKAVLEDFETNEYEGMIFTTCCDSSRRLFDTLARLHPDKFFFCFDLPRKVGESTVSLYAGQMERLIEKYRAFSGRSFNLGQFIRICEEKSKESPDQQIIQRETDLNVCLAGARPGSAVKQLIEDLGAHIALDLTCTGITRDYKIDCGSGERPEVLRSYAKELLYQIPCMRMAQVDGRAEALLAQSKELDGILYHTVKFCDIYSYEYTRFKETLDLPLVKLETDATNQCAGQVLTRIEAFLESLRARKKHDFCYGCPDYEMGDARLSMSDIEQDRMGAPPGASPDIAPDTTPAAGPAVKIHQQGGTPMYIMGIDSGSTSTNAVIINEKKEILSYAVMRTGAKSAESAGRILTQVLTEAELSREDLSAIISTGYGRVGIPFADKSVTEISCHGKGAHFLDPAVRTILDIGGQDSKAIRLNENGDVTDFVMNDKCAAGTGRFLEMMARTLEVDIQELGPLSLKSRENVEISSMCSVFAESEVISLIAQNKEPADIARGIHRAIAGKAMSLLKKVGLEREFMMTGGVAKNPGMRKVLEEMLDAPLVIYDEPEIVGALGAALFGLEG
ncbi:MAG: acyl-CoA dehydratase activase [Lachnospiraceae bacterium]|nr:acyl-CoA dehydratase activase [Lachnospiraceae bacterium]